MLHTTTSAKRTRHWRAARAAELLHRHDDIFCGAAVERLSVLRLQSLEMFRELAPDRRADSQSVVRHWYFVPLRDCLPATGHGTRGAVRRDRVYISCVVRKGVHTSAGALSVRDAENKHDHQAGPA